VQFAAGQWDRMYVMGDPPDYEPRAETSVAAIAAREGRSPDEVAYDFLTGDAGHFLFFPVTGCARDDHEPARCWPTQAHCSGSATAARMSR
jgi:N-acyl-D-aspartate/D-glutamate deacylase